MRKAEEMFALVKEWKQSGQSQKVFCQEHEIKQGTFAYWLRKKKQHEASTGGFLPVRVRPDSERKPVELIFPNGVRLQMEQADPGWIAALVRLWEC